MTLGDEEARKRKVQKTILERKGPPTFTCAVEMMSKTECRVHHRLDASVDAILAGILFSPPLLQFHLFFAFTFLGELLQCNEESLLLVSGKSPLIEVRHMYSEVNDCPDTSPDEKTEVEEFVLANERELSSNLESDDEEVDYSRRKSKKRSKEPVSKRTGPISVYTYKVILLKFTVSQAQFSIAVEAAKFILKLVL